MESGKYEDIDFEYYITFSVEEKGSAETIEKRWKQLVEDFRNPTANTSIIIGDEEKIAIFTHGIEVVKIESNTITVYMPFKKIIITKKIKGDEGKIKLRI
ncbi:MAG: hypothetical protein JZD40_00935 [Sulfolobus sp.]|nr:hypothetical protein [Sulfolobus sp.]